MGLILLLFTTLFGFIFFFFFARFFQKSTLINFSFFLCFCLFFFYCFLWYGCLIQNIQFEIDYLIWLKIANFNLNFIFFFDRFILLMSTIILIIGICVIVFSIDYMYQDPYFLKFISFLFLFIFFMLNLIMAHNFLLLFFGWEGVGLCSYLLISFWNTRVVAHKAALKALIINRIGDLFLLFAFSLIYTFFKTLNYDSFFLLIPYFKNIIISCGFYQFNLLTIISFFLLIGAIGKSAQIGLHTWLPDAMEGPTPVSALIHAATMVTAGIFLIIKCSFLFEYCSFILLLIIFLGGVTAFFAGIVGLFQFDIKRIIAYSTCSQLGLMFLICGCSAYDLSLFHLITHAFFKALLFLVAGALIHHLQDEQDLRKFGALFVYFPFLYSVLLIGSCTLMGFPFLSGFYSKDLIIEKIFFFDYQYNYFFIFLITIITLTTITYSMRLLYKSFFFFPQGFRKSFFSFHVTSKLIYFVLGFLSICSIFVGYFFSEIFTVVGNLFFTNVLFFHAQLQPHIFLEYLPFSLKLLPLIYTIGMFFFLIILFEFSNFINFFELSIKINFFFYLFFLKKWFFDSIQNIVFSQFFLKQSFLIFFFTDKGFLESFGPRGFSQLALFFSRLTLTSMNWSICYYYYIMCFCFCFSVWTT